MTLGSTVSAKQYVLGLIGGKVGEKLDKIISWSSDVKRREKIINRHEHEIADLKNRWKRKILLS